MSHYQLTEELIKLSSSQEWDRAKSEWALSDVELVEEAETCICGHYPIKEICIIDNNITNNSARVGNSCVKKFNSQSDGIFKAISRVKNDITKSLNIGTVDFAFSKNWISSAERNFYLDILLKRNLTPKQSSWKESINRKIMNKISH